MKYLFKKLLVLTTILLSTICTARDEMRPINGIHIINNSYQDIKATVHLQSQNSEALESFSNSEVKTKKENIGKKRTVIIPLGNDCVKSIQFKILTGKNAKKTKKWMAPPGACTSTLTLNIVDNKPEITDVKINSYYDDTINKKEWSEERKKELATSKNKMLQDHYEKNNTKESMQPQNYQKQETMSAGAQEANYAPVQSMPLPKSMPTKSNSMKSTPETITHAPAQSETTSEPSKNIEPATNIPPAKSSTTSTSSKTPPAPETPSIAPAIDTGATAESTTAKPASSPAPAQAASSSTPPAHTQPTSHTPPTGTSGAAKGSSGSGTHGTGGGTHQKRTTTNQ